MANPQHVDLLLQGAAIWNQWRKENTTREIPAGWEEESKKTLISGEYLPTWRLPQADLIGARLLNVNLSGADLREANLSGANLYGANLQGADLQEAKLRDTVLTNADFRDTKLQKADLWGARGGSTLFSDSDLSGADLTGASFPRSDFNRAIFFEARLYRAYLSHADFREVYFTDANLSQAVLSNAKLNNAHFKNAILIRTNLSESQLVGANFENASLVEADFDKADLTGCRVYGISAWNLKLTDCIQKDLVITRRKEPEVTVDDIEVAQFIYLLLKNDKLRTVIDTVTSKVILILGRFTEERKAVLDAIREELRQLGLIPLMFDFARPASKDMTGTVETLARMARFIIADLTDPSSIPHELATIVPFLRTTPVLSLRLAGTGSYTMFDDFQRAYGWVLSTHEYSDPHSLIASLPSIIAPANAMADQLRVRV